MKDKERMNYSSGLKETRDVTNKCNRDPEKDSGFTKNMTGTTGEME